MKVLVTGGAGFIGSNFVLRVSRTRPDWEITVLDALTYAGNRDSLGPVESQIDFVQGSIADEALVDRPEAARERRVDRRPERDRLAVHRPAG